MRLLLCCLAALARPTRGLLPRLGARTRGATCAPPRAASAAPESSVSGPDSVDALREQLFVELDDGFPLFTHANADGAPLQYERADGGGKAFALLYADIEHALAELAKNRREYPTLGLRVSPVGLGEACRRARDGAATIAPGPRALAAARDIDAGWDAARVPLFGCARLAAQGDAPGARPRVPWFMSAADAQATLDDARARADPAVAAGLALTCLSLDEAVERIARRDTGEYDFALIAPRSSMKYCLEAQREAERAEAMAEAERPGAMPAIRLPGQ